MIESPRGTGPLPYLHQSSIPLRPLQPNAPHENALSRIYAKLGVRSRVELAVRSRPPGL